VEIKCIVDYCRNLEFGSKPDYSLLYGLIFSLSKSRCNEKNFELDFKFPWIDKGVKKLTEASKILIHDLKKM
jgi:hypothetical protein